MFTQDQKKAHNFCTGVTVEITEVMRSSCAPSSYTYTTLVIDYECTRGMKLLR